MSLTYAFDGAGWPGWGDLLRVAGTSLAAVLLVGAVTVVVARRQHKLAVVDVAWGVFFVAVCAVAALAGSGDVWRRVLVAALVAGWALRLSAFIWSRSRGAPEDPRYARLLREAGADDSDAAKADAAWLRTVVRIIAIQAVAAWFVALPLQVTAMAEVPPGWLGVAGLVVAVGGLVFEAVGDRQLRRFKADPANRGKLMDRGLWSWTRHPNYFGDACFWWGVWLVAADAWPGVLTVASPALMTYFLVFATGARMLERQMSDRPGWEEYVARTSFFFPRPPRRTDTSTDRGAGR